jgi:hypothetical protein
VHQHAVHVATGEHPEHVAGTLLFEAFPGSGLFEELLDAVALQIEPDLFELELQFAQLGREG